MQAVGTLASGIAHDFNNIIAPIAVLAGVAEQNANDPEKLSEALERIRKAAHRARELTQQILSFGRKTASVLSPVAVAPVLQECMKLLRANIPPGVEVRLEIRSEAAVMGDPVQLFQVIMNLCTNAFQAMEERGGVLTVCLVDGPPGASPRAVVLEFRDTGIGIPEAVQARIFEPYFTTKESGKGTGLGLSVVHGIVESMRGRITVRSAPGQGATFVVTLPTV
jgi:signal transduction histidine kinase